jgi:hypothetical protein
MSLARKINQLTKKDFGESFVNAMDLAIKEAGKPRVSRANIKPSKSGCLRQMYYILTQAPVSGKESVNPDMYLIQQDGTYMHTVTQGILKDAEKQGIEMLDPAIEVAKAQAQGIKTVVRPSTHDADNPFELACYNENFDISFKFDGVGIFMKKKFILEIKNEDHFKWIKRTRPEDEHIAPQGVMYSICLGIDYVLFLYVGRNYKKRKAYLVEITEAMKENQILRVKIVKYCVANKIVPMREKHKGCTYCNHKKLCTQDGDKTHEVLIKLDEVRDYEIG